MALKHSMKLIGTCTVTTALLLASPASAFVSGDKLSEHVCATDAIQKDNRPKPAERLFRSQAVENEKCPACLDVYQLLSEYTRYYCTFS